jgi:poly(hydroxyalkanoate) depolymerase family esterase
MRAWRALVVVAAVTALAAPAAAMARPVARHGTFTKHTYPRAGAPGARDYWLYVPARRSSRLRPLVVYLHGCNETAVETAAASHFNALADAHDLVVVYPQETVTQDSSAPFADGNGVGCWNWFLPEDQVRGSGEPSTITGIVRTLVADHSLRIDPSRVYVEGVSAGADMAVILGATYPDVYAAVAAIAGCAYRTCDDVSGTQTHEAMGPRARVVPLFVENGTADTLNNVALAQGLVTSWLGADDLADDGARNGSVPEVPASTVNGGLNGVPTPGSGDACIHPDSFTCPGGVAGFRGTYPYTVQRFDDARSCEVAEFWVIHGMEHAHPDAPGDGPYTDPLGPDISAASYAFMSSYSRTGGCRHP